VELVASVSEVKNLLVETTMPQDVIDDSLECASALWLMSAPAETLAADLVLCHPPLGPQEIRAAAHSLDDGGLRLTVVAHDRPGLLADTAAVLAADGLSVSAASAMSWTGPGLALHSLTVADTKLSQDRWARLGTRLQGLGTAAPPAIDFVPVGRAQVDSSPSAMGRCVVTVTAPDQVGLLWAICRWFADNGVSIEAARAGAEEGLVQDHFIVIGRPDVSGLAARLTSPTRSLTGVAGSFINAGTGILRGVVKAIRPS
jgi:predicted amino acid-binding ACT domain protein